MQDTGSASYRVVRHRSALGGVHRAVVDDGTGAAELLVIPPEARGDWEHQVRVMGECPSPHLPAVRDLALDPDGTLRLVRSLVCGEWAGAVLARPGWCTPGRAVTLLHPIISTVRAAHECGAVLGGPSVERILITAEGCPVIADLSGAFRAAALPEALRPQDPAHLADFHALDEVRRAVIRALELSGFADTASSLPEVHDALADPDVLLRWSTAEPLVGAISASAPHADATVADPEPVSQPGAVGAAASLARIMHQVGLPAGVTGRVELAATDVAEGVHRVRTAASRLSRRTLGVAAAGAAILVALVLTATLPSPPGEARPGGAEATAVDRVATATAEDAATGNVMRDADDPTAEGDPEDWAVVVGELVTRWHSCVREQRLLCDDALHAWSGAAQSRASGQDAVLESLSSLIDGDAVEVVVVERSGDAVVVSLPATETAPASLLLIRSEAGWRIRDAWT